MIVGGRTHDDNDENDERRQEKLKLCDTYYLLPPSFPDNPWDPFPNENKHHQRDDDEENQSI